ncbi:MAG TPA: TonB-dependent receptor [Gemmatimonadaceae bacterium]|jgi:iron complex outermembrane receptor protein|nr:TonB-dependent receptor [Gemmatimonadaceae bacterium]HPV73460.1 TonB-dependent receptor [Gemmatimonadaceae bacterium]
MRRTLGRLLGTAAIAAAALGAVSRPAAAQSGAVQGRVADSSGAVIVGAMFTIDGSGIRTTSTARGRYTLGGIPVGRRVIRVRALGFTPESVVVNVTAGTMIDRDVTLTRSAYQLAPVQTTVGSRAKHTAAEELAVPVDVYTVEELRRTGSTETTQILANLSPSVNFPKQAVTDATEVVRPFTLRGLSPDHSLVLINGQRRHTTALLNVFSNGSAPGSSGVDLNAFPSSAIERLEVLRDGASTQYGSDAIAGVVNLVLKEGEFSPFLNTNVGQYRPGKGYENDGTTTDINGGVGLKLGRGSLSLFGQVMNRDATNRACPDGSFPDLNGISDVVEDCRVVTKRTGVPQPNVHWGDGIERDIHTFANLRLPLNAAGTTEFYAFGGYSDRDGTGNGFFRKPQNSRNWPQIYPLGFLPEFRPAVIDYSAAGGIRTTLGGWATDVGMNYGYNSFQFNLRNTLNSSLGPNLSTPTAPGPDGRLGTADDPRIPNQTSFDAGALKRGEFNLGLSLAKSLELGLPNPVNVAVGAAFRSENYEVVAGERASWINGYHKTADSSGIAQGGSSVFQGFAPTDASENSRNNIGGYLDLETNLSKNVLANVATRFENYSDFGSSITGKAALRYQPRKELVLRGAVSTGFRAPGLQQSWYSHTTTAIQNGVLVEIGNFPVTNRASRIFGAKPLKEESSVNLSAGMAWSPTNDFNLTVDLYNINITDRILLGATFDGSSDPVIAKILADSGLTQIAGVQFPTNALDTKTNGLDVAANYRLHPGAGLLDFTLAFNFTKNEVTRIDPLPAILVGKGSSYTSALDIVTINAIEKNRPDRRSSLTSNYSQGRFHVMGRISDYGKFVDGSLDGLETFGAKQLFDGEIGYRWDAINVSLGARNLFNTYPDQVKIEANTNNGTFIWPGASPFGYNGRYIYVRSEILLSR